jgi:hypothetical protein
MALTPNPSPAGPFYSLELFLVFIWSGRGFAGVGRTTPFGDSYDVQYLVFSFLLVQGIFPQYLFEFVARKSTQTAMMKRAMIDKTYCTHRQRLLSKFPPGLLILPRTSDIPLTTET